jgi:hypothetical protein
MHVDPLFSRHYRCDSATASARAHGRELESEHPVWPAPAKELLNVWHPVLQEELYSYVTVSDDQTFKGKTNITIESA